MNIKYLFGALISVPLLPIMYYQGKRIYKSVPKLPEAKGIQGVSNLNGISDEKPLQVISIGESTIAGVGVKTHKEGFTGSFGDEISRLFNRNVRWKVYARNGYTAKLVEKKIIPEISENQADLIIVGLGGNDAFTLNRPSKWRKEVDQLIQAIKSKFPNAIIVFCNMPPIKEFPAFTPLIKFTIGNLVEILGEELKEVVDKYDRVFYFDDILVLSDWIDKFNSNIKREDFFSDGVHLSQLTYQLWSKDMANKIYMNDEIKNLLSSS